MYSSLSAQYKMDGDYYSAVYAWFEKCGIVSNVRTHLRQNLVKALKCKDMTLSQENTVPKSAKQYVYDLLVAEYLWNHNYAYTLSIFASEAPMLVNFCKHLPNSESLSGKDKLRNDYVQHTLETLGMRIDDPICTSVIKEYAENDTPLLLCILKCVNASMIHTRAKARQEKKSCNTHNCQTQYKSGFHDSLEYSKLVLAKRKLHQQKETFSVQLKEKESELKKQAAVMERQMDMLSEKLSKAQNLMHSVNLKERRLIEEKKKDNRRIYRRQIELSTKEDLLMREADRLQKERDSYQKFESDLKKLQDELIKVKRELPNRDADRDSSYRDVQVQTESNCVITEKFVLERENSELSNLVKVQQARIEELTKRAVNLSRQVEEAQLIKRTSVEIPTTVVRFSKTSTILSESSSTEDILQDAKMRLRRLEEESLRADQCYLNCITASLQ